MSESKLHPPLKPDKLSLQGHHHKGNLPVASQAESPPGHGYLGAGPTTFRSLSFELLVAWSSIRPHAFGWLSLLHTHIWEKKCQRSAGTTSCSISAQLFWSQQAYARGWKWMHGEDRSCKTCLNAHVVSIYLLHNSQSVTQQHYDSSIWQTKRRSWLLGAVVFLHRYCDLSFRKLHSLVMNLYDLQYLLLAGAHRWSASTPDWQYAASNAEWGCVTSIKVENRTKISENRINFWERLF